MSIVRCEHVSCTFDRGRTEVVALRDVSCSVEAGDAVAVVGRSGSGKSTLLHVMAGWLAPTAGTVSWPDLRATPAGLAHVVGLVAQAPSLIESLTVVENVELPLLFKDGGGDGARDRAVAALADLGIANLAAALPEDLSAGQAQRAVIARVLAQRPRLILADEPTSRLDRDNADRVAGQLVEVAASLDAGLVVATHDQTVARRLPRRWDVHDGSVLVGEEAR